MWRGDQHGGMASMVMKHVRLSHYVEMLEYNQDK